MFLMVIINKNFFSFFFWVEENALLDHNCIILSRYLNKIAKTNHLWIWNPKYQVFAYSLAKKSTELIGQKNIQISKTEYTRAKKKKKKG